MKKHTILFLAANPPGTDRLALDEECAAIERELRLTPDRDDFDFRSKWAVSVDELMRHLNELQPDILHFSGHGSRSTAVASPAHSASHRDTEPPRGAGIVLQDGRDSQYVSEQALAKVIAATSPSTQVVVLNACYTVPVAESLRHTVDCVVGMHDAIGDVAARWFAVAFYRALGNRRSVGNAVEQANAALHAIQYQGAGPACMTRDGLSAKEVFLPTSTSEEPVDDTIGRATSLPGEEPRDPTLPDPSLSDPAPRAGSPLALDPAPRAALPPDSTLSPPRPSVALRFKPFVIGGPAVLIVGAVVALVVKWREPPSCPEGMVPVHAGVFWMGSPPDAGERDEHPEHKFTLPAYCIGKTEVTVEEYAACVAEDRCPPAYHTVTEAFGGCREDINRRCNGDDHPNHPINCIDWYAATAYCSWRHMRLPTEEEWEYAARGDDKRTYPWGDDPPTAARLNACGTECTPMARFSCNKNPPKQDEKMYDVDDGFVTTAPVGSFQEGKSPFGALDMAGNVWEWTASLYVGYSGAAVLNPSDADSSSWRTLRGGGWQAFKPGQVRTAIRLGSTPVSRNTGFGFRCAKKFP